MPKTQQFVVKILMPMAMNFHVFTTDYFYGAGEVTLTSV